MCAENCGNLFDDDEDGCIDGADSDCGGTETNCVDDIDNDCDGDIDELWDEDGDGFSPCAGDCDDSVASIHPAGTLIARRPGKVTSRTCGVFGGFGLLLGLGLGWGWGLG